MKNMLHNNFDIQFAKYNYFDNYLHKWMTTERQTNTYQCSLLHIQYKLLPLGIVRKLIPWNIIFNISHIICILPFSNKLHFFFIESHYLFPCTKVFPGFSVSADMLNSCAASFQLHWYKLHVATALPHLQIYVYSLSPHLLVPMTPKATVLVQNETISKLWNLRWGGWILDTPI